MNDIRISIRRKYYLDTNFVLHLPYILSRVQGYWGRVLYFSILVILRETVMSEKTKPRPLPRDGV
jgi:hypothetical protein